MASREDKAEEGEKKDDKDYCMVHTERERSLAHDITWSL